MNKDTKMGRPSKDEVETEKLNSELHFMNDEEIQRKYNIEINFGRNRGNRAKVIRAFAKNRGITLE